mmetsp:Transcript_124106/g.362245  ORF Transcript_124106/g.362245 Transcript_124106/m.362245 type:complete len:296 (-) Transcript_124106:156-1043(-)
MQRAAPRPGKWLAAGLSAFFAQAVFAARQEVLRHKNLAAQGGEARELASSADDSHSRSYTSGLLGATKGGRHDSSQPWYHPEVDNDIMNKIDQIRDEILAARNRVDVALEKLRQAKQAASEKSSDPTASAKDHAEAQRKLKEAAEELANAERDAASAKKTLYGQVDAMDKERNALKSFEKELNEEEDDIQDLKHVVADAEEELDRAQAAGSGGNVNASSGAHGSHNSTNGGHGSDNGTNAASGAKSGSAKGDASRGKHGGTGSGWWSWWDVSDDSSAMGIAPMSSALLITILSLP